MALICWMGSPVDLRLLGRESSVLNSNPLLSFLAVSRVNWRLVRPRGRCPVSPEQGSKGEPSALAFSKEPPGPYFVPL